MNPRQIISSLLFAATVSFFSTPATANSFTLLNEPVDISGDFRDFTNTYYLADSLTEFDPNTATGKIVYRRNVYATNVAFNNIFAAPKSVRANEFPGSEYAESPALPFSVEFISPRTIRIRMKSGLESKSDGQSLMLAGGKATSDKGAWKYSAVAGGHRYSSSCGSITILKNPWHIELRDADGKLLTRSNHNKDNGTSITPILPFSFVRRASDYSRSFNAVFSLEPGEKIFGCGESFTRLDKRGQKVVLWADDARGAQTEKMYKPVPFFMSSRGYGVFMHTSSPITCDFGKYFNEIYSLMIGDDAADLFVFLGSPKEILDEYTNLTGKAAMPPLWSFGLWMSRITYYSEQEGRDVAAKLRENRIPCDVIHFDTGWFETDWRCDYEFAKSRFSDPNKMIADLKTQGFHISLWQLPYFVPKNRLFKELVEKGFVVRDGKGNLPYEDAVLDFSNPEAVKWYQEKIGGLLKMGVGTIKVDFGEAAPLNGQYASGLSGFYEHNLYPLRYNKAAAEITKQITGDTIIWARSAWAGSQRYPVHWGGDVENTDSGMEAELRGGLSFGLSGFSFWSHDIGGFVIRPPAELYRRWLPFGMLTSHSRCHGAPPKEPWEYGEEFMNDFRLAAEMKYKLMPYVYAQAKDCSEHGLPMLRALFIEYPNDPGSWLVEDEYLFGSDILVAPLLHTDAAGRDVYLPAGQWIDYQTGKIYAGGWQHIEAGKIYAIILVRDGAVLPHIKLAQSTMQMDWSKLELVVYATDSQKAVQGLVCLPSDSKLCRISLTKKNGAFVLDNDPLKGKVIWKIQSYTEYGR